MRRLLDLSARIPTAAYLLLLAGLASDLVPALEPSAHVSEHVVELALVLVLFEGGQHLGLPRLRASLVPVLLLGLVGTVVTTAALAGLGLALGLSAYAAVLVATAIAPTDPAVVFSVLGDLEPDRSTTVLEGESGANDPVGIALLTSLLAAGGVGGSALLSAAGGFGLQLAVGTVLGVVGGRALERFPLPAALDVVVAFGLYEAAVALHGSGFLAVFLAGILAGGAPGRLTGVLSNGAEVVVFVVLGLAVHLATLVQADVLLPGLVLWVAMTFLVRPAVGSVLLLRSGLPRRGRVFVLLAGLKGAVPVLLGLALVAEPVDHAPRLFGIVVVVVVLSVVVQGAAVPALRRT